MRVVFANLFLLCCLIICYCPAYGEISASDWEEKGDQYYSDEEYDKAIYAYEEALLLNPDSDSLWSKIAITYYESGDYEQAYMSAEEALMINQSNSDALIISTFSSLELDDTFFENAIEQEEDSFESIPAQNEIEGTYETEGDEVTEDEISFESTDEPEDTEFIELILDHVSDIADENKRLDACIDENNWKNNCAQASSLSDKIMRLAKDSREEVYYIEVPENYEDLKIIFLDYARYAEEYAKYSARSLMYYDRAIDINDIHDMEKSYEAYDQAVHYWDLWLESWQDVIDEADELLNP